MEVWADDVEHNKKPQSHTQSVSIIALLQVYVKSMRPSRRVGGLHGRRRASRETCHQYLMDAVENVR